MTFSKTAEGSSRSVASPTKDIVPCPAAKTMFDTSYSGKFRCRFESADPQQIAVLSAEMTSVPFVAIILRRNSGTMLECRSEPSYVTVPLMK